MKENHLKYRFLGGSEFRVNSILWFVETFI
jgi:hypothetical protein